MKYNLARELLTIQQNHSNCDNESNTDRKEVPRELEIDGVG